MKANLLTSLVCILIAKGVADNGNSTGGQVTDDDPDSDPVGCSWSSNSCNASRSKTFPDNELTLAISSQRARVTVCLSWMQEGTGSCEPGFPDEECKTVTLSDGVDVCLPVDASSEALASFGDGVEGIIAMGEELDSACPSVSGMFRPVPARTRCVEIWKRYLELVGFKGREMDRLDRAHARCGTLKTVDACLSFGKVIPTPQTTPQPIQSQPTPQTEPEPRNSTDSSPPDVVTLKDPPNSTVTCSEPVQSPPIPPPNSSSSPSQSSPSDTPDTSDTRSEICASATGTTCVSTYAQCGGRDPEIWRCCTDDVVCVRKNAYFAQCRPTNNMRADDPSWSGEILDCVQS